LFYLKVVDLSFNRVNSVNLNSSKGLRELKIFNLNDILVSVIEVGFFEGLVGLVEVDLANNRLTDLKVNVFKELDKQHSKLLVVEKISELRFAEFLFSQSKPLIIIIMRKKLSKSEF